MSQFSDQSLNKIKHFCAYQERSVQEVRQKLFNLGVSEEDQDKIVAVLIKEDYVNESRFAKQFAGSKFRIKQWGKEKISQQLFQRGLDEEAIREALAEIDGEDYLITAHKLIAKYLSLYPGVLRDDPAVYKFMRQRGFEHELVREIQKLEL